MELDWDIRGLQNNHYSNICMMYQKEMCAYLWRPCYPAYEIVICVLKLSLHAAKIKQSSVTLYTLFLNVFKQLWLQKVCIFMKNFCSQGIYFMFSLISFLTDILFSTKEFLWPLV